MMIFQVSQRECVCKKPKKHRLLFSGGSSGNYSIDMCSICYEFDDKQFLISEETLN